MRSARGCEYLGFTFVGKRVTIKIAPKKLIAFKQHIKELTGRSRGISMDRRLTGLARYVRGWVGYFGLARQFEDIANLDGWLKRRIRMCYWKQWRYPRTKIEHLVALGVTLDMAVKHAISLKKYWRMSGTPALRFAMTNECPVFNYTGQQGLVSLKQLWYEASLRGTALYRRGQRRPRMLGGVGAAVSDGGGYPIYPFLCSKVRSNHVLLSEAA